MSKQRESIGGTTAPKGARILLSADPGERSDAKITMRVVGPDGAAVDVVMGIGDAVSVRELLTQSIRTAERRA